MKFTDFPARGPAGGREGRVAILNFKRSRVGALTKIHVAVTVAVGNLKKGCCLSRFHFKPVLSLLLIGLSEFTLADLQ